MLGVKGSPQTSQHSDIPFSRRQTSSDKLPKELRWYQRQKNAYFSKMVMFYHYTSEDCKDLILDTGVIEESDDGGPYSHYGSGVYGTNVPPTAGKDQIAQNNWRGGWRNREMQGRVDYAFEIYISRSKLQEHFPEGRHVYVHRGPIILSRYQWKLYKV